MKNPSAPRKSRDEILEAAIRVAVRDGVVASTLDQVAREAGVSKGGLIYHVASKDDLVREMLAFFAQKNDQALMERVANDRHPEGRWVRAAVDLIFSHASAAGSGEKPPQNQL